MSGHSRTTGPSVTIANRVWVAALVTLLAATALVVANSGNARAQLALAPALELPGPPPPLHHPQGKVTVIESPAAGLVRVAGYAWDEDDRTGAVSIRIGVGENARDPYILSGTTTANLPEPAVQSYLPVPGNHGFDHTFATGLHGAQDVCVHAENFGFAGDTLLGCQTIGIADPNPTGALLVVESVGAGKIHVTGRVADASDPAAVIPVHIYVGGPAGTPGAELHELAASETWSDPLSREVGKFAGARAFDAVLDTATTGQQTVCAYGINIGTGDSDTLLGCEKVTIDDQSTGYQSSLSLTSGASVFGSLGR